MVFSSLLFMFIYLPTVLAVYYIVPTKWRNVWLFVVNLIFYGWGEPVYILLMIFSICVNYFFGMMVDKHREDDKKARRFLAANTIINLALLFFFKYFDFIAGTLSAIPLLSFIRPLGITLPIGISFYTFQTMSYPIDVYRGDASVQKNFISFGTFVALFPQLIAGPIVRYKDISEQLSFRSNSIARFSSGVRRFSVGLAKKVLLANNIGLLWDACAATPAGELSVAGAWLGIIAFSFQIYFDFSGYSDMAIGLGRMLGFEFLENFNYPYISRSITEFWRRWHISLGTWFRDYVYIPLGGNRNGAARQLLNILIVWALTGIWHGASWNFLVWGVYYAVFLMAEKLFLLRGLEHAPVISHVYTLLVVVFGWALFSLNDTASGFGYIGAMFGRGAAGLVDAQSLYWLRNYAVSLIIMTASCTPLGALIVKKLPQKVSAVLVPILIVMSLALSTAYLVNSTYNPFLYFRF